MREMIMTPMSYIINTLMNDDNYFFVSVSKIQIINSGQIKGMRELVYGGRA